MKRLFLKLLLYVTIISCSSSYGITNIDPKTGSIEVEASKNFRMWKNIRHGSFTVKLTNLSHTQSVELYKVKSNGNETWISPSLLANSSQQVVIPADGHLFLKNFNPNTITIIFKIAE